MYVGAIFFPLLGACIAGFFGRWLGDRLSQWVTVAFMAAAALCGSLAFIDVALGSAPGVVSLFTFIDVGGFEVEWALRYDTLSVVMVAMVTFISTLIHLYSVGYMSHDATIPRFFAYLSLFTFAMLMLVTSDNLLQLFFGWEGVGLASYLLIGFWYTRETANAAAIKAFVVNRVGDFGFALGIFGCFAVFGSIEFDTIFGAAAGQAGKTIHFLSWEFDTLTTLCLLLFMGAMGKSAQFLLHTWLPDAMEGPTPVSALIHAATMVTAGVFLVARMSPMYELAPDAKSVIVIIGAITAFFAATVGLVQNDIKRVIAYSTCSQLGYMFVALGVGAYGVAIFHLFTHAFFKALLFLGSGSVIHAMSGEQDMRKMGGLAPHIRKTWILMIIGNLALTGFPFTAGYYSKDAVIESSFMAGSGFAFTLLIIAAFCTSFYSWRLAFMTFNGKPRADKDTISHVHESPNIMLIPLYGLAVGAMAAGYFFHEYFIGHEFVAFWAGAVADNEIMHKFHDAPTWVVWSPFVVMVLGFALAWLFYIRNTALPAALAAQHQPIYQFLLNKWYFDELYDFLFVRPAMWAGRFLWKQGDGRVIDGMGPDGVSARVADVTRGVVRLQTGYVYHYAFAMMIGVAALISWFTFGGSH